MKGTVLASILVAATLGGCMDLTDGNDDLGKADRCEGEFASPAPEGSQNVDLMGRLEWIELEGGFWGIIADNGEKFVPTDVCEPLREDGLRVHFSGRTRPDMSGIHQWGTYLDLQVLERA
jgi:hypothetical protein